MFKLINAWRFDPRNFPNLWILCPSPDQKPEVCSYLETDTAFVDPDPTPYTWDETQWFPSSGIGFCDSFFDANNTETHTHYYAKTDEQWCEGKTFKDFYASGFFATRLFAETDAVGSELQSCISSNTSTNPISSTRRSP